ncbi:MAG: NAD-dependent epimerase/dehydratase family protein [Phycisphaerae bacterium]|nr:NAD-dependent epimerase/dehydratase family protein [Phycisphaerae bacterium]
MEIQRKRVLITGAGGFFGRHLCAYLADLSTRPTILAADLSGAAPPGCDAFHTVDLSAPADVRTLIRLEKPDTIVHLAGQFGTDDALAVFRANAASLIAILEAVRAEVPHAVTLTAGSAAEYGHIDPDQLPVTEQTPCRPVTAYGFSKRLATEAAVFYHRTYGLSVTVMRPFQLIGRGVTSRLAPGAFAEQLREIIRAGGGTIHVGNLDSQRDFLDVHDAVEAAWMLCDKPAPGGVFNLCSGRPTRVGDLLDAMIAASGVSVQVEVDSARLRGASDVSVVYGSHDTLTAHCGWQPRTPLAQSVRDTLDPPR